MANVVVTHFSGIVFKGQFQSSCYYDGLISALQEQGHNVLQVITSDFLVRPWGGTNEAYDKDIQKQVIDQIKSFMPDLIISFNNSSIRGIESAVSCPIVLWDADSFEFFNDRDSVIKNQDRYHYFAYSQRGLEDYNKAISSSAAIKVRVKSATHIKRQNLEKRYNVSFIGNAFLNSPKVVSFLSKNTEYASFFSEKMGRLHEGQLNVISQNGLSLSELRYQSRGLSRSKAILTLLDFGVQVFGSADWLQLGSIDSRIFNSYDPSLVFSEHHNALVYNRSYVALNASHMQNITGYPWRVLDIMASSSALLTDFKSDLFADFPKVDFAVYGSVSELMSLTTKLLADKAWREDYVFKCNEAIDNHFRWKHRFKTISEITGVDLSYSGSQGLYKRLLLEDEISPVKRFVFSLFLFLLESKTLSVPAFRFNTYGLRRLLAKLAPESLLMEKNRYSMRASNFKKNDVEIYE